jgi:hypothetical protein
MQRTARERRYVSPASILLRRPFLRYDMSRSAYVLRVVGEHRGPVLRPDRRRGQRPFEGHDRRAEMAAESAAAPFEQRTA